MTNFIILLTSLILGFAKPSEEMKMEQEDQITTYYLIRHAEKDRSQPGDRDPKLTSEGMERARKWAAVLKDIPLDAVYSTDYSRTRQTAQPLAELNDLEIQIYSTRELYDPEFKEATRGKKVLVVGHSNTTPQFVNAIIGKRQYEDIDDSENGALFIVQVQPDGSSTSQVLYIN